MKKVRQWVLVIASKNTALTLVTAVALLAAVHQTWSQTSSCKSQWPKCEETIEAWGDEECDGPGSSLWQVGPEINLTLYACNNWYSGCGGTPGPGICNVMVKYTGRGRIITCPDTGESFACMETVDSTSQNLKRDCAGNYCNVPGGLDEDAVGWPPAPEMMLEGWFALPNPPVINDN